MHCTDRLAIAASVASAGRYRQCNRHPTTSVATYKITYLYLDLNKTLMANYNFLMDYYMNGLANYKTYLDLNKNDLDYCNYLNLACSLTNYDYCYLKKNYCFCNLNIYFGLKIQMGVVDNNCKRYHNHPV